MQKLQDLQRRTHCALAQSVKDGCNAKEQAGHWKAMLDRLNTDYARGEKRADKKLEEALAVIEHLTLQLKSQAKNRNVNDATNADRVPGLEREIKSLKSELKKRGERCRELSAGIKEANLKMECEIAQSR